MKKPSFPRFLSITLLPPIVFGAAFWRLVATDTVPPEAAIWYGTFGSAVGVVGGLAQWHARKFSEEGHKAYAEADRLLDQCRALQQEALRTWGHIRAQGEEWRN